ncbi:pinin/SDK/memA/ protein conserved region-domain-containing protein [Dichotomopilus funicola]|uniref:Pinin/SDK/memA/ protein conserved region-domain-containing protein n=1 Tax=Dichotomopilus funicola TaxID=1934379 RepID=A0AAN6UXI3_9PEZI|nr:pinin/SDK/memA/ protein conserved region-domain-containing protein [Dichotomopilus funicola]
MENATNKRKASPEITTDDAAGKRLRLDEDQTPAPPRNNADTLTAEGASDDFNSTRNGDESFTGKSPATRHTDRNPSLRRSPAAQRRPSATVAAGPPTRHNVSQEEKKRGQRLFGGLVSALNRSASGPQQQRRREIEKRQQERAQQRRVEDEKRRAEKLAGLKRRREIAQVELDEQAMNTRHAAMLDKAHSLHTKAEPRLYYLPWETTIEQDDIVEDQVDEAEETVARERADFKARKEQRLRALSVIPRPRSPSPPPQKSEQKPDRKPEPELEPGPGPGPGPEAETESEVKPETSTKGIAVPSPKTGDTTEHDEQGDVVLHDEEDTVIY